LRARALPGAVDVTRGVRSLHVHVDPDRLPVRTLVDVLVALEADLPATEDLEVPSRRVHLPLSFDDPAVAAAVERYALGVRATASAGRCARSAPCSGRPRRPGPPPRTSRCRRVARACRCRSTTPRSPTPSSGTPWGCAPPRRGCRRTSSSCGASTGWRASTT